MPDPTPDPPRYAIRAVGDFLSVPPDRLDECLEAFRLTLETTRPLLDAIDAINVTQGGPGLGPITAAMLPEWTWIDDGESVMRVQFTEMERGDADA